MTRFQKLAGLTLLTAILLVTVGVVVRATDSGLGCPDWPLCHGQLIPPLDDPKAWIEWVHRGIAVIIGFEILGLAALAVRDHRDRRSLVLGYRDDGHPLGLAIRGRNILVAGDPKSGKSWVTGLLCEQLILSGYSLCIIDPEGDYVSLEALRSPHSVSSARGTVISSSVGNARFTAPPPAATDASAARAAPPG